MRRRWPTRASRSRSDGPTEATSSSRSGGREVAVHPHLGTAPHVDRPRRRGAVDGSDRVVVNADVYQPVAVRIDAELRDRGAVQQDQVAVDVIAAADPTRGPA